MKTVLLAICFTTACASTDEPRVDDQQQSDTLTVTTSSSMNNRFKGMEANASFHSATTDVFIDLFENISGSNITETFLFYQYSIADTTSQVCTDFCYYAKWTTESGMGDIPSTDAQITTGSAHVTTSTSDPGFTTTRCTFDSRDGSDVCTVGTAGTISINWNRDGVETIFVSGNSTTTSPTFSVQTNGTFTTNSALAAGSLPGNFTFSAYAGSLIDSRNSFITHTFTRNH